MRYLFTSSLLVAWLAIGQTAYGQSLFAARQTVIGVDVSKNIPAIFTHYFFQRSLIVEPSVRIPLGHPLYLTLETGYASIRANPIYQNLDYRNQGVFAKIGVDAAFETRVTVGGAIGLSVFDEFGRYRLREPYYGDVYFPLPARRVVVPGGELRVGYWLPMGSRFFLVPAVRMNIHANTNKRQPDVYYIPGMGVTSRNVAVTGGFSVSVQYSVRRK